jgi:putative serine protease PepD
MGVNLDATYTGVGAKILKLVPDGGAEKAGIPEGSVIRSIDGVKTNDQVSAIVRIRSYAPGAVVTVLVDLPTGGQKSFKVTLGSTPSS